jgi:hypothetical protein
VLWQSLDTLTAAVKAIKDKKAARCAARAAPMCVCVCVCACELTVPRFFSDSELAAVAIVQADVAVLVRACAHAAQAQTEWWALWGGAADVGARPSAGGGGACPARARRPAARGAHSARHALSILPRPFFLYSRARTDTLLSARPFALACARGHVAEAAAGWRTAGAGRCRAPCAPNSWTRTTGPSSRAPATTRCPRPRLAPSLSPRHRLCLCLCLSSPLCPSPCLCRCPCLCLLLRLCLCLRQCA